MTTDEIAEFTCETGSSCQFNRITLLQGSIDSYRVTYFDLHDLLGGCGEHTAKTYEEAMSFFLEKIKFFTARIGE